MFFLGLAAWLLFMYGLTTRLCCPYTDTDTDIDDIDDTESSQEEQTEQDNKEEEQEPETKEVKSPPVLTRMLRVRTQSQRRLDDRVHYTAALSDCEED